VWRERYSVYSVAMMVEGHSLRLQRSRRIGQIAAEIGSGSNAVLEGMDRVIGAVRREKGGERGRLRDAHDLHHLRHMLLSGSLVHDGLQLPLCRRQRRMSRWNRHRDGRQRVVHCARLRRDHQGSLCAAVAIGRGVQILNGRLVVDVVLPRTDHCRFGAAVAGKYKIRAIPRRVARWRTT
jgi:hypothetical protein